MLSIDKQTVLFTAHSLNAEKVSSFCELAACQNLHLPLEQNRPFKEQEAVGYLFQEIGSFSNVMYDSVMHAQAFLEVLDEQSYEMKKNVKQLLHLVKDQETASFLEAKGFAPIQASANGKAIEVMELLIRLKRLHPTIYPSVHGYYEEFPALMHELGAACTEIPLIEFTGPSPEQLADYRYSVVTNKPSIIFFHAPNAVVRTQAAFPDLDFSSTMNIAYDDTTANKIHQQGLPIYAMGRRSWDPKEYHLMK